jgi:hypothetical protein
VGGGKQRGKFFAEAVEALYAFAEREFAGQRKLSDGASKRDHQDSASRQLAQFGLAKPREIEEIEHNPVELPDEVAYVWSYFEEFAMGFPGGGFSVPSATWETLMAWATMMHVFLDPWESRALMRLSIMRANILGETKKTPPGKRTPSSRKKRS